jgi:hypothetical protein
MSEEFSFADWLAEGIKGARKSITFPGGKCMPEEFRQHMKASRKEFLLAFRSLFDTAIDKMDRPQKPIRSTATKIKVE